MLIVHFLLGDYEAKNSPILVINDDVVKEISPESNCTPFLFGITPRHLI